MQNDKFQPYFSIIIAYRTRGFNDFLQKTKFFTLCKLYKTEAARLSNPTVL